MSIQPLERKWSSCLILPGGGFGKWYRIWKLEAADGLPTGGYLFCPQLPHATSGNTSEPPWKRPLQDAQRAMMDTRQREEMEST